MSLTLTQACQHTTKGSLSLVAGLPGTSISQFVVSSVNGSLRECNITSAKFSDTWQTGSADQPYKNSLQSKEDMEPCALFL